MNEVGHVTMVWRTRATIDEKTRPISRFQRNLRNAIVRKEVVKVAQQHCQAVWRSVDEEALHDPIAHILVIGRPAHSEKEGLRTLVVPPTNQVRCRLSVLEHRRSGSLKAPTTQAAAQDPRDR
jgi:hypothetical protein